MNTRVAIKENFDEDDLSDDVDDEVFVRDGKKSIMKTEKQKGDERPLMPPRRKSKQRQNNSNPEVCNRQPCNIYNCLLPVYFTIATIISLAFLMLLYVFLVNKLPLIMKFDFWPSNDVEDEYQPFPCQNIKLERIWIQKMPKLTSDSQIKLLDVNRDNVEDIIIGIGTELDDINNGDRMCAEFFDKSAGPCSGGVIAIDGKTGEIIWHRWLRRLVLAVHCEFEITGDFISDCIATGKGGLLVAISGADGAIIWELEKPDKDYYINLYNVLITHDLDSDNHMDVIASHTSGDNMLQSHLIIISGREGKQMKSIRISPREPILHAPQLLTDIDGNEVVLFITGDLLHAGGIYIIPIHDLVKGDKSRIKTLYHYNTGILAAPVLVDVNLDGLQDIAYVADNSVHVLDGATYDKIWNASLYDYVSGAFQITAASSVTPAYFNEDWVPDLLVSFAVGSGYPEYYFSMTLVLDGKNGALVLANPVVQSAVPDTVGAITLSTTKMGRDAFLYWTAACEEHETSKDPFTFVPQENREFWTDLCALRFNTSLQMQFFALFYNERTPGRLIYSAKSHKVEENFNYNVPDNSMEMSQRLPLYYKTRGKNSLPNSMVQQMQPMESENTDDKAYSGVNDNDWKSSKTKYVNYDMNENNADTMDYEDSDTAMNSRSEKEYGNLRFRRDVQRPLSSTHKMLPKVSATGALTKSFDGENLDLILAHYEVRADDDVRIIIGKNEECIQNGLALASIPSSKYHGLPRRQLKEQVFKDCLGYTSFQNYMVDKFPKNKLLSLQMGNLYITRNRIGCDCYDSRYEKSCDFILPYEKQSYPMHMGRYGNSAFKTRVPFD